MHGTRSPFIRGGSMADATVWDEGDADRASGSKYQRWPSRAVHAGGGGQTMARLVRTIEGEIIPRLLLPLQPAPASVATEGVPASEASVDDVAEFATLVATHDVTVASAYVSALLSRGVSLEKIYLDLLAPAARLLGEWWKDDLRDFTEVTSGLCRMHQLLHEFSDTFLLDAREAAPDRCVLLVPMPGDQHSFGLIMVAEFFRRAGWDVWDPHPSSVADLLAAVHRQWYAVIGLSLSCESRLHEIAPLIVAIRAASRNPG